MSNVWNYRDPAWLEDGDLVGYTVAATDGPIGKIDQSTNEIGSAHVVVGTRRWSIGRKRLVPAGAITDVDHPGKSVMVNMTKAQIRSAPGYEPQRWSNDAREQHDRYYGPFSW